MDFLAIYKNNVSFFLRRGPFLWYLSADSVILEINPLHVRLIFFKQVIERRTFMKTPILIVDANAETLRTIKQVITSDSIALHFAQSEDEALREVLSTQFSLLLIATRLPLMSGGEVVRLLRKVKKGFSAPIMLLETKSGTLPEDSELFDLGVVDSLNHPWSFITLKNKVNLFVRLEQQRLRAQAQEQAFSLMKDYFVGMLSQELRTPVQTLRKQIQHLKASQSEEEKAKLLQSLQENSDKILRWLEQVERGKASPTPLSTEH